MHARQFFILLVALGFLLSFFLIPYAGYSQVGEGDVGGGGGGKVPFCAPGRVCFGGRIQDTDTCTCPYNGVYMWLKIGPPVSREIVLTFSSLLYLHYAFNKGNWALGDAGPVKMSCQDIQCGRKGCWCVSTTQGHPVLHIGTSASGGSFSGGGGGFGGGGASGGF